ncbi:hypothetical protein ACFOWZ_41715 [Lentzea rhizosphaerae]|uniref:Secreted protein n=1 Tax=Lentzea rhizosphaerae TaxID=2041025 RepID=A0ABV8C7N1_9PSEU
MTVAVVVKLTLSQATVLARAAVVVTSALDCKEVNAAEQGLLAFRAAVGLALSKCSGRVVADRPEATTEPALRAS